MGDDYRERLRQWWADHRNDAKIQEILQADEFIYQEQKEALERWMNDETPKDALNAIGHIPNPGQYTDGMADSVFSSIGVLDQDAQRLKSLIGVLKKKPAINLGFYLGIIPMSFSLARYRVGLDLGRVSGVLFDYYKNPIRIMPLKKEIRGKVGGVIGCGSSDSELISSCRDLHLEASTCKNALNQSKLYCEILWHALELSKKDDNKAMNPLTQPGMNVDRFDDQNINKYVQSLKANRNIILHGAPGTGKTYLARKIAEQMGCSENEIGFVQFHPSYDYTDFVEGLRPANGMDGRSACFEYRPGTFRLFCARAQKNLLDSRKTREAVAEEKANEKKLSEFIEKNLEERMEFRIKNGTRFHISDCADGKVMVKSESCGECVFIQRDRILKVLDSGRPVEKVRDISEVCEEKYARQQDSYIFAIIQKLKEYVFEGQTRHNDCDNSQKNYVFIIDEINRGEISKIFGELFYSIDPGYRGEKGRVKTQYQNIVDGDDIFSHGFFVPENVYIIGTMNDIDRSVESMDFAMRRRFAFMEVKADDQIAMLNGKSWKDEAIKRMRSLNQAIENVDGLSTAYHVGPAYFLKLDNYDGDFVKLWDYHIKGLLTEYFRGMPDAANLMEKMEKAYNLRGE